MNNSTNTVSENTVLESGYDLSVYGLANGVFYYLHIPALFCISCSFCCVVISLILSFRHENYRTFFSWTKSERFIVYLALCDGGFNISHSMDHLQYVITKYHIRPKELCEFYGFLLAEFISAQNLMVNVVATNAFTLTVFKKNIDFGKYDWRLLAWTFGLPFVGATAAAVTGQLGPTGSFCLFDGVRGGTANIFFTTVPLILILIMNSIMYAITWKRIRQETISLNLNLQNRNISNRSHRAAKNMSMFVVAFFIQWFPITLFGIWQLLGGDMPLALFHTVTIFSNIGGCLNLGIYIIIRRRDRRGRHEVGMDRQPDSNEMNVSTNSLDVPKIN
ncbi:uncharacterized protein LOC123558079 [Mercenaria mercenaria]|uniref:uncharacterized protein LOC123558079 n=1 Tax=Mercenaria mercenaria TaxID=6596 RepID=UPI00234E6E51|nr:uncharacterized protein LOC123558079 [Mercenaria mercenaria]